MRVNLGDINRDEFAVEPRHHEGIGTLVLVRPRKIKHRWQPHELWLRSLLCREDGTVVSCGFPKFFNYGEDPASDALTERALAADAVEFTEKVDGSLIIRSVVDGVVIWRTRGSHDLGPFRDAVMRVVEAKYPALLDPTYASDGRGESWLFEFVDPDQPVCLRYPEADLRTLARITHSPERDRPSIAMGLLALGMPDRPRRFDLYGSMDAIRQATADMQDEGVVAWCRSADGWHLTKFKSRRYLALHAIRSNLNERRARIYFAARGVRHEPGLREAMAADGIDWEVGSTALQWLPAHLAADEAAYGTSLRIWDAMAPYKDRKGKAQAAKVACEREGRADLFTWAMASLGSDADRTTDAYWAAVCGLSVSEYRAEVARLKDLTAPVAEDDAV